MATVLSTTAETVGFYTTFTQTISVMTDGIDPETGEPTLIPSPAPVVVVSYVDPGVSVTTATGLVTIFGLYKNIIVTSWTYNDLTNNPVTIDTVPELGTFKASTPPIVILTSNRTRDVHDALKRRCLYHWVDHPSFDREVAIVRLRVPQIAESLAKQVAAAVEQMRSLNLYKPPGVAETIDWATALAQLGARELNEAVVSATLGTVLKYREDHDRVREQGIAQIVAQAFDRGLLHG